MNIAKKLSILLLVHSFFSIHPQEYNNQERKLHSQKETSIKQVVMHVIGSCIILCSFGGLISFLIWSKSVSFFSKKKQVSLNPSNLTKNIGLRLNHYFNPFNYYPKNQQSNLSIQVI